MPRLPTADDLGLRIAQNNVSTFAESGGETAQALQKFGSTLLAVNNDRRERKNRMAMVKAKTAWQVAKIEADNAFEQDTDYETFGQRYSEMLDKAEQQAVGLIEDEQLKSVFQQEILVNRTIGMQQINAKAFQKEKEVGLADLDSVLTAARENALRGGSQFALETANEAIEAAVQNTYMGADDAQALRRKFGQDMAVGLIEVQPLKKQKEMLTAKQGHAELIPLDIRKKMLESVDKQLIHQGAMEAADMVRQEGGSREERLEKVRKIKDADIRKAAESQVLHDLQQEKLGDAELKYDIYQEAAKGIIAGGTVNDFISENPKEWQSLTAEQQSSLMSVQDKGDKKTDLQTWDNLNRIYTQDRNKAYEYFVENAHRLSDTDAKKWSDRLAKPEERDGYLTRTQRLGQMLQSNGIEKGTDEHTESLRFLDEEFMRFEEANGRKPDAKEEQAILDFSFEKAVDGSWNPFVADKYVFELPKDEVNARKFERILESYRSRSDVPLADDDVMLLYQMAVDKGLIDE